MTFEKKRGICDLKRHFLQNSATKLHFSRYLVAKILLCSTYFYLPTIRRCYQTDFFSLFGSTKSTFLPKNPQYFINLSENYATKQRISSHLVAHFRDLGAKFAPFG